jgi:hypothetical protein
MAGAACGDSTLPQRLIAIERMAPAGVRGRHGNDVNNAVVKGSLVRNGRGKGCYFALSAEAFLHSERNFLRSLP